MTSAVVVGYASMDYPVVLDGRFEGDQTAMVKSRPVAEFPRPGGCPLYVATPLARAGLDVSIISWVGDDAHGRLYIERVSANGIGATGIGTVENGSTPMCLMVYQQDGSCGCCFDPGMLGRETLTDEQAGLLKDADIFCVTVGPPDIAMRALSMVSDECRVAWVAKNDAVSFPADLRARLGKRADYIFCNQHEREWIDDAVAGSGRSQVVFETAGEGPVTIDHGDGRLSMDVPVLSADDTCGTGDTFAGGCLGAIASGEQELQTVAGAGIGAATELLKSRLS